MCQLMRPDSRGRLTLPDPGRPAPDRLPLPAHRARPPPPAARGPDRRRAPARRAWAPASSPPATSWAPTVGWTGGSPPTSTTAQHLCGTAAMGSADDPLAVVDPALRVHGIERLRVVDLSVLPVAPRRGTAATAVAVGDGRAGAEFLGAPGPVRTTAGWTT